VKFRRATKLPAPEYVDTLMNWVQSILDDETIFPNKIGRYLENSFSLLRWISILNRCAFPSHL